VNAQVSHQYQTHHDTGDDLEKYVGFRASEEISHHLKQMEFKEIAELKESLETILMFLSADKIYN
jgi:hypothetical protein